MWDICSSVTRDLMHMSFRPEFMIRVCDLIAGKRGGGSAVDFVNF